MHCIKLKLSPSRTLSDFFVNHNSHLKGGKKSPFLFIYVYIYKYSVDIPEIMSALKKKRMDPTSITELLNAKTKETVYKYVLCNLINISKELL